MSKRRLTSDEQLLCKWHVSKAVTTYTKLRYPWDEHEKQQAGAAWHQFFQKFNDILNALTENDYLKALEAFESEDEDIVNYVKRIWLAEGIQEWIVPLWTDKHRHFRVTVMSIVEGHHSKLKKELRSVNLNIYSVYNALKRFWNNEKRNYENMMAGVRMRRLNRTFHILYDEIISHVTPEALHWIARQSDLLNRLETDCKGQWQWTQGLLCRHTIKRLRENEQLIPLSAVNRHWHWERDVSDDIQVQSLLREPATIERRSKPTPFWTPAGGGITGTRRNPSGFELVIPGLSINSSISAQRLRVFIAPRPTGLTAEAMRAETVTQKPQTTQKTWTTQTLRNQPANRKSQLDEILETVKGLQNQVEKIQNEWSEQQESGTREMTQSQWTSPPRRRYSPPQPDVEDDLISNTWSMRSASEELYQREIQEMEADFAANWQQNEKLNWMLRESRRQLNENDLMSSDDEVY